MTDIVERLRGPAPQMIGPLMDEAAEEIKRLRAERDALLPWGRGMTDIVERLRQIDEELRDMPYTCETIAGAAREAAYEIERLRLALEDAIECLERGVYDLRLEGYLRTATILEECAGRCRRHTVSGSDAAEDDDL